MSLGFSCGTSDGAHNEWDVPQVSDDPIGTSHSAGTGPMNILLCRILWGIPMDALVPHRVVHVSWEVPWEHGCPIVFDILWADIAHGIP